MDSFIKTTPGRQGSVLRAVCYFCIAIRTDFSKWAIQILFEDASRSASEIWDNLVLFLFHPRRGGACNNYSILNWSGLLVQNSTLIHTLPATGREGASICLTLKSIFSIHWPRRAGPHGPLSQPVQLWAADGIICIFLIFSSAGKLKDIFLKKITFSLFA